jgi:hypothetical protein
MTDPAAEELLTVRLLGFPLQVHDRAQRQSQEMRREFQLVLGQEQLHPGSVPARLLHLSAMLSERYAGFTEQQELEIEEAIAAGGRSSTSWSSACRPTWPTPWSSCGRSWTRPTSSAAPARCWCSATPADLVHYRNWYLDQFSQQAAGQPPQPWSGPLR